MANAGSGENGLAGSCGICLATVPAGSTCCVRCRPLADVVTLVWYNAVPRGQRNWGWMKGRQAAADRIRSWGGLAGSSCGLCSAPVPTSQNPCCERCHPLADAIALACFDSIPRDRRNWEWMKGRRAVEQRVQSLGGFVEVPGS